MFLFLQNFRKHMLTEVKNNTNLNIFEKQNYYINKNAI